MAVIDLKDIATKLTDIVAVLRPDAEVYCGKNKFGVDKSTNLSGVNRDIIREVRLQLLHASADLLGVDMQYRYEDDGEDWD